MRIKMVCLKLLGNGNILFKRAGLTKRADETIRVQAVEIAHARLEMNCGAENALGGYYVRDVEKALTDARKKFGAITKLVPMQIGGRTFAADEPDRGTDDCLYALKISETGLSDAIDRVRCVAVEVVPASKPAEGEPTPGYVNARFVSAADGPIRDLQVGTISQPDCQVGKLYDVSLEHCPCETKGE